MRWKKKWRIVIRSWPVNVNSAKERERERGMAEFWKWRGKNALLVGDAGWNGFISLSPGETEANRGVTRRGSQLRFAFPRIHESFWSISRVYASQRGRQKGGSCMRGGAAFRVESRKLAGRSRNVTEKAPRRTSSPVNDHFYRSLLSPEEHVAQGAR